MTWEQSADMSRRKLLMLDIELAAIFILLLIIVRKHTVLSVIVVLVLGAVIGILWNIHEEVEMSRELRDEEEPDDDR